MAQKLGYDDTSMIAGTQWRVHDDARPHPRPVYPGNGVGAPPEDAKVLFDGADLSQWKGREGEAQWKVESGYMEVTRTGDIETKEHFGDCQLHLEWAEPEKVEGDSQGRGNSGVFLMGRYEIQVLDGYDNPTYADGQVGAIYGQYPPRVNASRRPGEWQTYDMVFETPRWDGDGKLEKPAYITVFQNGIVLHHRQEILGPTGHKSAANYDTPHPAEGPLKLQDHGNPLRFRNIWIRPLRNYDTAGAAGVL